MQLLTTIYRHENVNIAGKTFLREAVRGIIFRNTPPRTAAGAPEKELLMIYSPVNGDYKFPGGGVKTGELHLDALQREIREESGATFKKVKGELGKVIEYDEAMEADFETFKMVSYYYFCEIDSEIGDLDLDDYEAELGFQPVWVDIETALETNKRILTEASSNPGWTRREAFVLALLR